MHIQNRADLSTGVHLLFSQTRTEHVLRHDALCMRDQHSAFLWFVNEIRAWADDIHPGQTASLRIVLPFDKSTVTHGLYIALAEFARHLGKVLGHKDLQVHVTRLGGTSAI